MQMRILSLVVLLCIPVFANAQKGDADGWVSMFNGKSLEGWTQKNGWASYRVEDGAIVGTTSEGSPNSFCVASKNTATLNWNSK